MGELLDINQAAEILHLSRFTLYKLTSRGRIEHYKLGSALRFSQEQLKRYLDRHAVEPIVEPVTAGAAG